ncbi:putative leucine-rich repeat domain, L domain-containing protein [Medicago truncatula]|nr:putative leucine-rich repeat domain, L domain-containing protein [Medicago truncatula]
MHDLLQEMGRQIVREESIKNPGQRSRLWNASEICDVLTNNNGTSAVESICLDMDQITRINLSSKAFTKMPNLRLLAFKYHNRDVKGINYVHLPEGLDFLPNNLRSFEWSAYPLNYLPSNFSPWNLVELHLPYSNLEKLWNGTQNLPSLERIDLRWSAHLIECPKFSNAPNLYGIDLGNCESISHVDPSIFNLPKLEWLDVSGCKSLESLYSSTRSQSQASLLADRCYNLQEFISMPQNNNDPSITTTWIYFSSHISESLVDLPENFAYNIEFSGSTMNEQDTFTTLHKVLPSPCFRYVKSLTFYDCNNISEIPDSISLLSLLESLYLIGCPIISLPESINCLPRLMFLEARYCKMLQSIPSLPQSIQWFYVWYCKSLHNVLNSTNQQTKKHQNKSTFLLPNCIELDRHSFVSILKDAIARIELGAKPLLPADVLENKEEAASDNNDDDGYNDLHDDSYIWDTLIKGKICYMLPAGNFKNGDWFHYHSTQTLVSIELPPSDHLGFIFYLVFSQVCIGDGASLGCDCYLETTCGECISIKSFFLRESVMFNPFFSITIRSDHLFLWYDKQCCEQIMEAIKEIKANDMSAIHNPKLTFKFFAARTEENMEAAIKECGFRWIYSSEGQVVEEEEGCESETSKETHTVEGSKSDEQEETVPPAMNFQQSVYGTLPNLETAETEDLRGVLEELLHIGFGGDLML